MQSVRFVGVGRPAQIQEVPKPSPGPGQVLIKIGGAGVCHSDLHVMEEDLGFEPSEPGAGSGSKTSRARRPGSTLRPPAADAVIASLGTTEGRVARALGAGLATVDELVAATNLPVAAVLAALSMLETRGLVVGAYGRYRPAGALDPLQQAYGATDEACSTGRPTLRSVTTMSDQGAAAC